MSYETFSSFQFDIPAKLRLEGKVGLLPQDFLNGILNGRLLMDVFDITYFCKLETASILKGFEMGGFDRI